jgi:formate/nitrite transporter FocA (FNT family)
MQGTDSGRQDVLRQEPSQIAERASDVGEERLDRGNLDILVTSFIGGAEVSLGGLAAMTVLGSAQQAVPGLGLYPALALAGLAFPIGFLFVIVGRSELFTENFLIPVVSVFQGERKPGSLVALWLLSWVGNVVGCGGTALLLSVPDAIGEPIKAGFAAYTEYKLSVPLLGVFVSAVLAGGVMTALTWLLLAIEHPVGRIIAIFAAGYVLFASNLSHSIVSTSVLLAGFVGAHHSLADVAIWVLVATAGNLVGGLGLVTLFRLTQAHQDQEGKHD